MVPESMYAKKKKAREYRLKDNPPVQGELPGMPERTPLMVAAETYLNHLHEKEMIADEIEKARDELIEEFSKAKMDKIKIDGKWISYEKKNTEVIKIEKSKG